MSLLDELRHHADELKSEDEKEQERQERLQRFYKTEINPTLIKMYRYLHELVAHLNYIKPDIKVDYEFPLLGCIKEFSQGDYGIGADSDKEMKEIKFHFACSRNGVMRFHVVNNSEIQKLNDYFLKVGLQYHCKKEQDEKYNVTGAHYTVKAQVPIMFHITADIEASSINLHISNFEKLGLRKSIIKPDQITDDFLDRLGKYILREEEDFLQTKLSDEERSKIREKLLKQQQALDEELQLVEQQDDEEDAHHNKKQLLKKLFRK